MREKIAKISTINSIKLRNETVDEANAEAVNNIMSMEINNQNRDVGNISVDNPASGIRANVAMNVQSKDGQLVKIVGIVTAVKKKYTKNNTIMAFITLEDLYGSFQVIAFDSVYNRCSDLLIEDSIVLIEGKVSNRDDDESTIIARSITDFGKQEVHTEPKSLMIDIRNLSAEQKRKLKGAIRFFCRR